MNIRDLTPEQRVRWVRNILENCEHYEWTVQGFGFMRAKLSGARVHIWDSSLRTPHVSDVHTHPWPFTSTIISGELVNLRYYSLYASSSARINTMPYHCQQIQTGEGGGLIGEPDMCMLAAGSAEMYTSSAILKGDIPSYSQESNEIHRTVAADGTVTLLERPQGPPDERAVVYWPLGASWISAEPRPATPDEVERVISYALVRWFQR